MSKCPRNPIPIWDDNVCSSSLFHAGIIGETPAELLSYDTLEASPKKRRPTGLHSKEATKRKAIVSPLSSTLPLEKFPLSGDDKTGAYCRQCGKFVSGLQRLRAHERYHEKSGRFKCRFCGKLFAGKGDMKRHERIHTGEKPYNCSVCERSFATLSNRKTHESNVHFTKNKDKYTWGFCNSCSSSSAAKLRYEQFAHNAISYM